MIIWVDADSLPRELRELIARRTCAPNSKVEKAIFVANRPIPLPVGAKLQAVVIGKAGNLAKDADEHIATSARPGDIVITRDIPLAARIVEAGMVCLNDRGDAWTADTVRERLSLRNAAAALRDSGLAPEVSKVRSYGPKEKNLFANALDRAITHMTAAFS